MDKSNTNSEEIFDNNNGNIKTIETLSKSKYHICSQFYIYIIIVNLLFSLSQRKK